jgi:trehalose 6-phosphate synthase/phosphatase
MNTTSMEFVIAQGRTKKSPLILSEFMGISSNMADAMQINPWNLGVRRPLPFRPFTPICAIVYPRACPFVSPRVRSLPDARADVLAQDMASSMHRGLTMSEEEKAERHAKLHDVVTTHTSHTWALMLVKMLLGQIGSSNTARQTPVLPTEHMLSSYKSAKRRLFMLDYDVRPAPSTSRRCG